MYRTSVILLLLCGAPARAALPDDVAALAKPGADPAATRAAWDRVVAAGPPALLPLLKAWPADDPVAANWLRTAFDQIAKANPAKLPTDELLAFASDPKGHGKARRVALAAVERGQPGTTAKRLAGWLGDPEFGPDAVADRLAAADALTAPAEQVKSLRATFAAATDLEQALLVAKRLTAAGDKPDVLTHLGVVRRWHVVGPFPVSPDEGLTKGFPPEAKIDLAAGYEGKAGTLKWQPAANDPADARLDVVKLGVKPDDGSVAYAVATVKLAAAAKVELRASAVDNLTVWVNGNKVTERASEYRSMFRPDRYRATVELPAGESVVLVKLTKTKAEEVRGKPSTPVKWDFLVRLVGSDGRAAAFTQQGDQK
ncbi:hypothetical protein GobsT_15950 [Gemmata obscuriglobus]|uniref:HEAT repeat domain-containing protein n=1 Tax=Gemmata obscuriglobus TaxID=114 RepID=A0A2Z3GZQ4_9BACT|nr:hypothetical protein [Gemmata obscuriglobus]AWM39999.1 hypothetical protein C1280_25345 [Gemmata obscuriglobus]QEG26847.1 hypothetical protein GobsT_15950 [Gemmata obscuriglobus]VTS02832.1 Uncharacterized protein OS=Pirellula staleyi (strain ATCC 27377 / DSM 6068 / ICPB 4128) GN=Psta_2424 PE=4 SV=1 [Gemmata obscuriglobus UQM 2246]